MILILNYPDKVYRTSPQHQQAYHDVNLLLEYDHRAASHLDKQYEPVS